MTPADAASSTNVGTLGRSFEGLAALRCGRSDEDDTQGCHDGGTKMMSHDGASLRARTRRRRWGVASSPGGGRWSCRSGLVDAGSGAGAGVVDAAGGADGWRGANGRRSVRRAPRTRRSRSRDSGTKRCSMPSGVTSRRPRCTRATCTTRLGRHVGCVGCVRPGRGRRLRDREGRTRPSDRGARSAPSAMPPIACSAIATETLVGLPRACASSTA